ncbi:MAG: carboxypeptidase regulatory-like domain-containing protein [Desulfobacteraceae bacterium]
MKRWLLLVLIITLILPASAFAKRKKYEVVDVENGGSIVGTIKAAEMVADPMGKIETEVPEETKLCGGEFKMNKYIISADLGVKNVIVALKKVAKGKAMPKQDLTLDNKDCQFHPLVSIAYKGSQFVIHNSDPIFHNTSLGLMMKGKRSTVYNLALPIQNTTIKKPVRRTGMISVKCDSHKWMRAYVYAAKNPYVAVTDKNGKFEITDILPGTYKVMVWHEGFGEVDKTVEVKAGQATTMDHTFTKP